MNPGPFAPPSRAHAHHGGTEARRSSTERKPCHELLSVTSWCRERGSRPRHTHAGHRRPGSLNLSATGRFVASVGMACHSRERTRRTKANPAEANRTQPQYPFSVSPCLRGEVSTYAAMGRRAGAILLFAALAAGGCGRRAFYEWRDEPYLRPVYAAGEGVARARMASRFADERDIGCRTLSVFGREAARAGDTAKARELARVLIMHCEHEPNPMVRSVILAVCLRNVGAENEEVHEFLKGRVAFGGESASAAYALAALGAPGAFESIAARYRAVGDYGLKYELLGALWLLGDARAVGVLEEALAEMERSWTSWPKRIHHMRREMCVAALRSRLVTLRASVAASGGKTPGPEGGRQQTETSGHAEAQPENRAADVSHGDLGLLWQRLASGELAEREDAVRALSKLVRIGMSVEEMASLFPRGFFRVVAYEDGAALYVGAIGEGPRGICSYEVRVSSAGNVTRHSYACGDR
jgi:hypothetical protein